MHCPPGTSTRTLRNWPVQAAGAEIMHVGRTGPVGRPWRCLLLLGQLGLGRRQVGRRRGSCRGGCRRGRLQQLWCLSNLLR
jgi:hypothetical protein